MEHFLFFYLDGLNLPNLVELTCNKEACCALGFDIFFLKAILNCQSELNRPKNTIFKRRC